MRYGDGCLLRLIRTWHQAWPFMLTAAHVSETLTPVPQGKLVALTPGFHFAGI